jgi:hypothetical protein
MEGSATTGAVTTGEVTTGAAVTTGEEAVTAGAVTAGAATGAAARGVGTVGLTAGAIVPSPVAWNCGNPNDDIRNRLARGVNGLKNRGFFVPPIFD